MKKFSIKQVRKKSPFALAYVSVSIFALAFMGGLFAYNSFLAPGASHAETSTKSNFSVNIEQSLSVAIEADEMQFEITPTPEGTFSSSRLKLRVYTNADGYKLYFAEDTEQTAPQDTVLLSKVFSSLTGQTTPAEFPVNHWGYSTDAKTYQAVPTTTSILTEATDLKRKENEAVAKSETTVYFGAKANTAIPAGIYTDTILFTATTSSALSAMEPVESVPFEKTEDGQIEVKDYTGDTPIEYLLHNSIELD
ncbi:MAG: hypothetical protein Q4E47_00220 [Candidatus Saccharibacteria bacterium]|nr:hypothetical protein [Candidatus Saccharibacteria bacterium]